MASLSTALTNGNDTLSITADCYSMAGTDAIAAALLATPSQSGGGAVGRLPHSKRAEHADAAIAGALLPTGRARTRTSLQPTKSPCAGGVPLSRRPGHLASAAAQLLDVHHQVAQPVPAAEGSVSPASACRHNVPGEGAQSRCVAGLQSCVHRRPPSGWAGAPRSAALPPTVKYILAVLQAPVAHEAAVQGS